MRSDEQIKKDIVDELFWDNRIDASKVNVTVENGVVTLDGEVLTYSDISAARAAAWRMEGVIDVVNNLRVNYTSPPVLPTDDEIRTRANNILAWEPSIDESTIGVSVLGGIVTLEGTVDAYWKKAFAESKVMGIRGILGIENKLAVTPVKTISDEAVANDVVAALKRDVLVDEDQVTVEVTDGTVRLSGKVPGWASRGAAENDAIYTAGVRNVRNELKLAA